MIRLLSRQYIFVLFLRPTLYRIGAISFVPQKRGLISSKALWTHPTRRSENNFLLILNGNHLFCVSRNWWRQSTLSLVFNFPPSQNQLHLQYIVPPLLPHQYFMFARGQHFTPNRFFPLSYVEKCLGNLTERAKPLATYRSLLTIPIDEVIDTLDKECGLSYESEHEKFISRVREVQNRFGNWTEDKFHGVYRLIENDESKRGETFV
ncbi:hypothetical protein C3747_447g5 [Trypanosoma cruzi]|uniref:Uncharacterized protein n=1 Tax=Trypanosoma cruzi TaxID=5693 RepID=A0A2V2UVH2_TRYCR|nr:hypothetical protein C3747_447g5 [Trypanosoma cruzi]